MATGGVTPAALGPLPANITARQHIPQLSILAVADVFLTHGGMNSTMEALYYGVPMVAVPQMGEQEVTAHRLEQLGLGRFIDRDAVTPELLAQAVTEVMESTALHQRVQAMQHRVRAAGGTSRAADVIERTLRQPTQTPLPHVAAAPAAEAPGHA